MDLAEDLARIEGAAEHGLSGVALITRGGETVFAGAWGLANRADGVPNTLATRFGLASVTKMFTAVAVVDLATRGRLDLHRPLVELLPPRRRPTTLRGDVTAHHLLCHCSGIADYFEEQTETDYASLWARIPTYSVVSPADVLPLFADLPSYRAPGLSFQYSNAGYVLLGLLIEEVAGAAYVDVVAERVLGPAGMTESGFFALDEVRPRMATGYLPPEEPAGMWRSNIFSLPAVGGPDGGLFASAGDLSRFLTAYDDGTLMPVAGRDLMLTPQWPQDVPGIWTGYGVHLYDWAPGRRERRFGHGGGDPGVEVLISRLPELDANTVVLTNVPGSAGAIRDVLVAHVLS